MSLALFSRRLNVRKNCLPALLFLNNTLLNIYLIVDVDLALLLQDLLQAKVLLGELHGAQLSLLHLDLLLFIHSLGFEGRGCIEQFIFSFEVLLLALFVIVEEEASFVIFVINLLEVAVLTATRLALFAGLGKVNGCFTEVTLMTDESSVLSQVVISIVVIGLLGFGRHSLAQVLHLQHLLFVIATAVAVVGVRIGQWLNWAIRGNEIRRDRPRLVKTRVFLLITWLIIRLAHATAKFHDKILEFSLNEELADFALEQKLICSLGELAVVIVLKSRHHANLALRFVLLIGQVVSLTLALLPQAGPDEHREDDDVLEDLNVELSAPVHIEKTDQIDYQDYRVTANHVDLQELFLEGTEYAGLRELGGREIEEAPEG